MRNSVEVAWVFPTPEEALSTVFAVEVEGRPHYRLVSVVSGGGGYCLVFVRKDWA